MLRRGLHCAVLVAATLVCSGQDLGTMSGALGGDEPTSALGSGLSSMGSGDEAQASGEACPLPGSPVFDHNPELESYANNDPVTSSTDRGSLAANATQGTGAAQPTFKDPCEAGKVSEVACYDGDGGDELNATFSAQAQPGMICGVIRYDSGVAYIWDSDDLAARAGMFVNTTFQVTAGTAMLTGETPTAGAYHAVCMTYNATSSSWVLDWGTPVVSNAGTNSQTGLTILGYAGAGLTVNGAVVRIARWNSGDIPTTADVKTAFDCAYGSTWPAEQLGGHYGNRVDPRDTVPATVLVDAPADAKRYAVALRRRGATRAVIVNRLRAKKGISRAKAIEVAKSVRGRRQRDPASLHSREIGLLVRRSHANAANAAIAQALCRPLADEADTDAASCLAAEAAALGEAFCAAGTTKPTLVYGARLRATPDEAAFLRTAAKSVGPLRMVGVAADAAYFAKLQEIGANLNGAPVLARCDEARLP